MSTTVWLIAGLVILPVIVLLAWAWFTRAQVIEELVSFKATMNKSLDYVYCQRV